MTNGIRGSNQPSESWFDQNAGFLFKLGIFIILLIVVLFATGYMKKIFTFVNPDLENCKSGVCRTSCIKGSELPAQGVNCSDTSQICCVPNKHVPSPECQGKIKGDPCGDVMLCDEYSICLSRCEYCSVYPDDKYCEISEISGKAATKFDSTFSCGCTDMDCNTFENSKMGTCVKGFCPSNNPLATDYMCCSTLYKK